MEKFETKFLADCPESLPIIANWIHTEWGYLYPERTLKQVNAGLIPYLQNDKIPLALVTHLDGHPVATAGLCEHDMDTHQHLSPWLESVFADPAFRKQGLGEQIILATMKVAENLGIRTLYLYTPHQKDWYKKFGWHTMVDTVYHGQPSTIMYFNFPRP